MKVLELWNNFAFHRSPTDRDISIDKAIEQFKQISHQSQEKFCLILISNLQEFEENDLDNLNAFRRIWELAEMKVGMI